MGSELKREVVSLREACSQDKLLDIRTDVNTLMELLQRHGTAVEQDTTAMQETTDQMKQKIHGTEDQIIDMRKDVNTLMELLQMHGDATRDIVGSIQREIRELQEEQAKVQGQPPPVPEEKAPDWPTAEIGALNEKLNSIEPTPPAIGSPAQSGILNTPASPTPPPPQSPSPPSSGINRKQVPLSLKSLPHNDLASPSPPTRYSVPKPTTIPLTELPHAQTLLMANSSPLTPRSPSVPVNRPPTRVCRPSSVSGQPSGIAQYLQQTAPPTSIDTRQGNASSAVAFPRPVSPMSPCNTAVRVDNSRCVDGPAQPRPALSGVLPVLPQFMPTAPACSTTERTKTENDIMPSSCDARFGATLSPPPHHPGSSMLPIGCGFLASARPVPTACSVVTKAGVPERTRPGAVEARVFGR